MTRARPMSRAERAALGDAMRHMLASGLRFQDVRRGLGLPIHKMPRDAYLPRGHAKGRQGGVSS